MLVQTFLWVGVKAARQRCSWLCSAHPARAASRVVEPRREGGFCFSDISVLCWGTTAVPHSTFLEKAPLGKCCKCHEQGCQQGSPGRMRPLSPAETCVPVAREERVFCTAPRSLKVPRPPCATLSPRQGWARGLQLAITPPPLPHQHPPTLRRALTARPSGRPCGQEPRARRVSSRVLQQPRSALARGGDGLLP